MLLAPMVGGDTFDTENRERQHRLHPNSVDFGPNPVKECREIPGERREPGRSFYGLQIGGGRFRGGWWQQAPAMVRPARCVLSHTYQRFRANPIRSIQNLPESDRICQNLSEPTRIGKNLLESGRILPSETFLTLVS